jgi:hypothetical protein
LSSFTQSGIKHEVMGTTFYTCCPSNASFKIVRLEGVQFLNFCTKFLLIKIFATKCVLDIPRKVYTFTSLYLLPYQQLFHVTFVGML